MKTKLLLVAALLFATFSFSQTTYIPDDRFEQTIIDLGYDDVLDDYVVTDSILKITELEPNSNGNFTGLEDFVNLKSLGMLIQGNFYNSTIDLSKLVLLEKLNLSIDKSILPDISNNLALKELVIKTLDTEVTPYLKNHLALEKLKISISSFGSAGSIDLSNLTALKEVDINKTAGLNLSNCTALETLSTSSLSEGLDVSGCTALKSIKLGARGNYAAHFYVNSLDVSSCTALESLILENNSQIEELDLSKNENLNYLYLRYIDNLATLNVQNGNNQNLEFTSRTNPKLTCIQVDDAVYSTANWSSFGIFSEDCDAARTSIPDNNFEQALIDLGYDTVLDDYVVTDSIKSIISLDVSSKEIEDLTGIEAFTALQDLNCSTNLITSLDLSTNLELTKIDCTNNMLTSASFNISQNAKVIYLVCYNNNLTTIDVSHMTALETLSAEDNAALSSINVSGLSNLVYLGFTGGSISAIDVSSNTALQTLRATRNSLTSLDVTNNTELTRLILGNNALTHLDLSNNTKLRDLTCADNQLASLNLKNITSLLTLKTTNNPDLNCVTVEDVDYANSNFTDKDAHTIFSEDCNATVDLTQIPDNNFEQALIDLGYDTNLDGTVVTNTLENIISLDVSGKNIADLTGIEAFINLQDLNVNDNLLISLDTRHNTELVTFTADDNVLTYLDVCENHKVTYFSADNNAFTGLNIKNNNNVNITYFSSINNPNLTCITVDNAAYSTANWLRKDAQSNYNEDCTIAIPDDNFEKALVNLGIDDELDNKVTLTNAVSLLKTLDVSGNNISDLTGIENFLMIEQLNVANNDITELNLTENSSLNTINLDNNQLTSVDLKNGNNTAVVSFSALNNGGLTCINVDNAAYSTTNWTSIDIQTTFGENCYAALSTEDIELEGFALYPNPVENKLTITILEEANYTLANVNGQILLRDNLEVGKNIIDVNRIANGIYFLTIKTDRGMASKKIVKY